jgi:hypothetical protein
VNDVQRKALITAHPGDRIVQAGSYTPRKKNHFFFGDCTKGHALVAHQRMFFRQCEPQRFFRDSFQGQCRFVDRQIQKPDPNAAFPERVDLCARAHVLQLDTYSRVFLAKLPQRLHQNIVNASRDSNGQVSDFAGAGLCRYFRKVLHTRKHLIGFVDHSLPGLCQTYFPFGSLKELNVQFLLQLPDLLTQRGLADVQAYSRTAEVQLFSHRYQIPQMS